MGPICLLKMTLIHPRLGTRAAMETIELGRQWLANVASRADTVNSANAVISITHRGYRGGAMFPPGSRLVSISTVACIARLAT